MPFNLEKSKELYRQAYPNFIAIYWAYVRERLKDGVPILHEYEELTLQQRLLTTTNLDSTFEGSLDRALDTFLIEFEFIFSGVDTLPGGYKRENYVTPHLEAKYTNFLRSPAVTETINLVSTYLESHHGKKIRDTNRRDSPGRDYGDWTQESFEMLKIGHGTASQAMSWATLLKHGLGDSMDI
jgi:hypothetical protein